MAPAERRRRALDRGLFLAGRVERVGPAVWVVPSQTDASGIHVVTLLDGHLRCDCLASAAGHPCAHGAAVALVILAGPAPAASGPGVGIDVLPARKGA
jgi:hypothetical protein